MATNDKAEERHENPAGAVFAEEDGKLVAFSLPSVFRGAAPVHDPLSLDLHPEDIHDATQEPKENSVVVVEETGEDSGTEAADHRGSRKRQRETLEERELQMYRAWKKRTRAMEGGPEASAQPGGRELRRRVERQRKSVEDWSARVEATETQLKRIRQSLATEVAKLQQLEDALAAATPGQTPCEELCPSAGDKDLTPTP